MAIELCSDNSPRVSFSHDFICLSENVPVEQHSFVGSSNSLGSIDFDFCIRKSFEQESSPANELFSDGKILPKEIKKRNNTPPEQTLKPSPDPPPEDEEDGSKKEETKEVKASIDETEEKQSSKSFWRFKRSSSLNCVSGYGRSLCPLPLLSRSNSTGSAPNNTVKRVPLSKDMNNSNHHRQPFIKPPPPSTSYQKPPLKKNYGTYANGVRVSPVLNVPSGNLFGLGSIFFNGKDKNKKK